MSSTSVVGARSFRTNRGEFTGLAYTAQKSCFGSVTTISRPCARTLSPLLRPGMKAHTGHFQSSKGADRSRRPFTNSMNYIFFSEHTFLAASHAPPAFAQSAAFFAAVTSPANAGIANPRARERASEERRTFMAITPCTTALTWKNAKSKMTVPDKDGEFRYASAHAPRNMGRSRRPRMNGIRDMNTAHKKAPA